MIYCFDKNLPFKYSKIEMKICKDLNIGILYDSQTKTFTDYEGNLVDIKGKLILARSGSTQIYDLNEQIVKQGGIPIVTTEQIKMVFDWPNHYQTKRKTEIIKARDLIEPSKIVEIENEYGNTIFIKTKMKNFSDIISTELIKDKECVFYKALQYHLDEDFIISENVNPSLDEYGIKEYRCFVVNNEIYNISRFTDNILHKIDEQVFNKAQEIVDSMKNKFPNCYSFDLFEYQMGENIYIDVVEFNPIHATGLYLYNSVIKKSDDILHNNVSTISEEFFCNVMDLKTEGKLINNRSNLYFPNTFAGDLRSIFLVGDRGLIHTKSIELTPSALAKHVSKPEITITSKTNNEEGTINDDTIFRKDSTKNNEDEVCDKILKLLLNGDKKIFK